MTLAPHDALFRQVFSEPRFAREELRAVLPPDLVADVDWPSLELLPGRLPDLELEEGHVDVLYRVRIGDRRAFLHLILEHKSTADPWTVFQVFGYAMRILRSHRRRHPRANKLPAVIAVVVHHSRTGWSGPTDLAELLDVDPAWSDELVDLLPRFRILVDDLTRVSDAQVRRRTDSALVQLALLCLKRVRDATDPACEMRRLRELFRNARAERDSRGLLISVLIYMAQVWRLDADEFQAMARIELGDAMHDEMPTVYEQLVNRGREKGREEGREEGRADLLLELLAMRFGPVPDAAARRVRSATPAERSRWQARIFAAASLDEVLAPED